MARKKRSNRYRIGDQLVIIKRTDNYHWGVFNRYGKILMRNIYWLHCRAWIDEQQKKTLEPS